MTPVNVAISIGDPAGIGPEILSRMIVSGSGDTSFELTVFSPPSILEAVFQCLTPTLRIVGNEIEGGSIRCRVIGRNQEDWTPGFPSPRNSQIAWQSLDEALNAVVTQSCQALVTLPIHKANMKGIGFPFDGHTDYLASRTGTQHVVMCYDSPGLKVALATTHIALKDVFRVLTPERIVRSTQILNVYMIERGYRIPRLAIAGLNPHAGSGDRFGDEEQMIIEPAIVRLRRDGLAVSGPIAPDSVFLRARRGEFDAVVSLYHDQGSIAVKTLDFDNTVNITLGLPIIRTSVDHGTAYDLAGKGLASHVNLDAAIHLASQLVRGRM